METFLSRLSYFKNISGFSFLERIQQPLVKNNQCQLLVLLNDLTVNTIVARNGELGNKFRKPDVSYLKKAAYSRHSERTGNIRFVRADSAEQKDIVPFRNIIAGR